MARRPTFSDGRTRYARRVLRGSCASVVSSRGGCKGFFRKGNRNARCSAFSPTARPLGRPSAVARHPCVPLLGPSFQPYITATKR